MAFYTMPTWLARRRHGNPSDGSPQATVRPPASRTTAAPSTGCFLIDPTVFVNFFPQKWTNLISEYTNR